MDAIIDANYLVIVLGCSVLYLVRKFDQRETVPFLIASFAPVIAFQLGSYFFTSLPNSRIGARLIILATALTPITLVPLSHILGRARPTTRSRWTIFYTLQVILLAFVVRQIFAGGIVELGTGTLEQRIIIVENHWRFYFLNIVGSSVLALVCFEQTLRRTSKAQQNELKFILVAFVGFSIYFICVAVNILLLSYISESMLQLGSAVVLAGLVLLTYGFAKYPLCEINIRVSRHLVFGTLSTIAAVALLILSAIIVNALRLAPPHEFTNFLSIAAFALLTLCLGLYLSPNFHRNVRSFITRNFFRDKYDYRDLWMRFSEKSSGSLNIRELLPRVGEFVADAMFVGQVAFWLRSSTAETYHLAYCRNGAAMNGADSSALRVDKSHLKNQEAFFFRVPSNDEPARIEDFPIVFGGQALTDLGIQRVALVEKDNEILAIIGIGGQADGEKSFAEDEQFLSSVSNHLGHLMLTHKLSEELLLAREWDSFNRFASFILHDLKNLATLQGMTLENARDFNQNPEFISDAFATFGQTTEKMINLIASLSVQRGQFSLNQQPVNILKVIANTFDDLKIEQRNGLRVRTMFPPINQLPAVSGDPDLLQKAFTNLLLNAIQSLPEGRGAVEVMVSNEKRGKITASIRDTGCGIAAERLGSLFRPFETTKEKGLGIGLCHTRSIIEVHGGHIRIESRLNAGTNVEVELPTL